MDEEWAKENLDVIRTLMERAAVYRHALAPVAIAMGFLGLLGWGVTFAAGVRSSAYFLAYWMAIGVLGLAAAVLIVRAQALRHAEPFWSPPTRRVALALAPAWGAGFGWAMALFFIPEESGLAKILAPPVWMILYGCGLHAAGFFMKRGIKLFGVIFILAGLLTLYPMLASAGEDRAITAELSHRLMGVSFGGFHMAYGVYLYFTEQPRKSA